MTSFIIAEAGVNHNGSIKLAYKLIDEALSAGADAVKFQTFKAKNMVLPKTKKANYQKNKNKNETQFDMLKKYELSLTEHKKLINYCKKKGIIFLSSAFDIESIDILLKLKLDIFKIPSGEINNLPYLRYIGSHKKKIILSTGMSTMKEIEDAIKILVKSGTKKKNITVMHTTTMYPTPMEDVNLNAMKSMRDKLKINVGYSDHTPGIEIDVAAIALGASMIEKHFTLDKKLDGPDHKASLNPKELRLMIKSIRNIEKAMGNGIKKITKSEKINLNIVRKSIVVKKSIKKGEIFSEKNLTTKRPGTGLSPMQWDKIIGKVASRNYKVNEIL